MPQLARQGHSQEIFPVPPPSVSVINHYPQGVSFLPLTRREIGKALLSMLGQARDVTHELESVVLHLTDDCRQAGINCSQLGLNGPTNILSFPDFPEGELVLSISTFTRECFLYGQDPAHYLLNLLAHGMGHLAGYEHGDQMIAFCNKCLSEWGLSL